MSDDRKEGTIRRLFPDKVYGFICCPLDQRDYFFHQAQLDDCTFGQLKEGDVVTFTVGQSPKGRGIEAQDVRLDRDRHESPMGTRLEGMKPLPEKRLRKQRR
jgi:CspA family cold shock protein